MKKQVLVTADRGETRVAMLEAPGNPAAPTSGAKKGGRRAKSGDVPAGYRAAEIYFERRGSRSIVGNIYKGKVDNVLPGLEAAATAAAASTAPIPAPAAAAPAATSEESHP